MHMLPRRGKARLKLGGSKPVEKNGPLPIVVHGAKLSPPKLVYYVIIDPRCCIPVPFVT